MIHKIRAMAAMGAALLLSACLVTPGKFDSTLDIRADRSFAFTYKGEIIAHDLDKGMPDSGVPEDEGMEDESSLLRDIALGADAKSKKKAPEPDSDDFSDVGDDESGKPDEAQMQAIATALSKEKGFRSARYMGNSRFEVDYAISGKLTHGFVFPFNLDARLVFPFVAIELRGADRVRVKAPGFSNSSGKAPAGIPGADSEEAAKDLKGSFTLTTDAEIVSQNQEDGAVAIAGGRKIVWSVDALTTEAPMAVLKVAAE